MCSGEVPMNIVYGEKETAYLAARDKRLGAALSLIHISEPTRRVVNS